MMARTSWSPQFARSDPTGTCDPATHRCTVNLLIEVTSSTTSQTLFSPFSSSSSSSSSSFNSISVIVVVLVVIKVVVVELVVLVVVIRVIVLLLVVIVVVVVLVVVVLLLVVSVLVLVLLVVNHQYSFVLHTCGPRARLTPLEAGTRAARGPDIFFTTTTRIKIHAENKAMKPINQKT